SDTPVVLVTGGAGSFPLCPPWWTGLGSGIFESRSFVCWRALSSSLRPAPFPAVISSPRRIGTRAVFRPGAGRLTSALLGCRFSLRPRLLVAAEQRLDGVPHDPGA